MFGPPLCNSSAERELLIILSEDLLYSHNHPPSDSKVALVLVHAAPEVGDVLRADGGSLVLGVHGGLAVLGLSNGLVGRRSGAGAAAEPATNSVTDGGTDSDTAVWFVS